MGLEAGKYRVEIIIEADDKAALEKALKAALKKCQGHSADLEETAAWAATTKSPVPGNLLWGTVKMDAATVEVQTMRGDSAN